MRAAEPAAFPRADQLTVAAAGLLVAAAIGVGVALNLTGPGVQSDTPPLYALWRPHLGPGTPAVLALAAAVVLHGQRLAATLSWRRLLVCAYGAAVAWTFALAMVDGWQRGLVDRLIQRAEYLYDVPGVTDIGLMLREFTSRILDFQPDSWTTHVSGHPPGALLVFVWLDRIGLGGGAPAAIACVLAGALVAVAVPVTLRALRDEAAARATVPFLVLLPGAVWFGASADAIFTGVTSAGIALLALGLTTRRRWRSAAFATGAGLLLGFGCYLSYGLILMAPIALAAIVAARPKPPTPPPATPAQPEVARQDRGNFVSVAPSEGADCVNSYAVVTTGGVTTGGVRAGGNRRRAGWVGWGPRWRLAWPLGWMVGGALVVVGVFTAAGFWWFDGYELVVRRYYQGIAADRPYRYWIWANLACLLLAAGPAAAVIIRRAVAGLPSRDAVVLLPLGAATAILAADLSGLSKAEVERIWLPFAVWLLAGAALLPARSVRGYLVAGAVVATVVNHLLLTIW